MSSIDWAEEEHLLGGPDVSSSDRGRRLIGRWADAHVRSIFGARAYDEAVEVVIHVRPGWTAAREVLRLLRPPEAIARCVQFTESSDSRERTAAVMLLSEIGGPAELPHAVELVRDSSETVRSWAVRFAVNLVMSGEASREDVAPVLRTLESSSFENAGELGRRLQESIDQAMDAVLTRAVQHDDED